MCAHRGDLLLALYFLFLASSPSELNYQAISSGAKGEPQQLTLLDAIFFFLLSTEACINSYAGALRGRSPDSMSGTGMSSILPLVFLFAHIRSIRI